MNDDVKRIGLIVIVVVIVVIAVWSGMRSFNQGAGPASPEQGQQKAKEMQEGYKHMGGTGGGSMGVGGRPPGAPPPGVVPGATGQPAPGRP